MLFYRSSFIYMCVCVHAHTNVVILLHFSKITIVVIASTYWFSFTVQGAQLQGKSTSLTSMLPLINKGH